MDIKKETIIHSALTLFTAQGFTQTTVQEIAEVSKISKGSFYTYFSSKDELLMALFKYYLDRYTNRITEIDHESLSGREKMIKQLAIPFENLEEQKKFLVMYMREQNFGRTNELKKYMQDKKESIHLWYVKSILKMYGPSVKPYVEDIILVIEGIRHSYLTASLMDNKEINTNYIGIFLMNRLDQIVEAFKDGEKKVLLRSESLNKIKYALQIIEQMKQIIVRSELDDETKRGLQESVGYIMEQINKEVNPFVIQGLLANFKDYEEFNECRMKLSQLLDLKLL